MNDKNLETTATPEVHVEAHGKLVIKGWEDQKVRARSEDEALVLEEENGNVRVVCNEDLDLRLPAEASLVIETAAGDAIVKGVTGRLEIKHAGESLTLVEVGPSAVDMVGLDLNARNLRDDLAARQVGRFLNAKDLQGSLKVDFAGSHINLKRVQGGVQAVAGENATLFFDQVAADQVYSVEVKGVLSCKVPEELDAAVTLESDGPITVKVGETSEVVHDGRYEATFGEGRATIHLKASGPLSFSSGQTERRASGFSFDFDFEDAFSGKAEDIAHQVNAQMSALEQQLEAHLSGFTAVVDTLGLSEEQKARIDERTQEKLAHVQEKIARAQERAARKIEQAQHRAARRSRKKAKAAARGSWSRSFPFDTGADKDKSDPVSDEERMMILNMLAEKKISMEEAEALLAALEGK